MQRGYPIKEGSDLHVRVKEGLSEEGTFQLRLPAEGERARPAWGEERARLREDPAGDPEGARVAPGVGCGAGDDSKPRRTQYIIGRILDVYSKSRQQGAVIWSGTMVPGEGL